MKELTLPNVALSAIRVRDRFGLRAERDGVSRSREADVARAPKDARGLDTHDSCGPQPATSPISADFTSTTPSIGAVSTVSSSCDSEIADLRAGTLRCPLVRADRGSSSRCFTSRRFCFRLRANGSFGTSRAERVSSSSMSSCSGTNLYHWHSVPGPAQDSSLALEFAVRTWSNCEVEMSVFPRAESGALFPVGAGELHLGAGLDHARIGLLDFLRPTAAGI